MAHPIRALAPEMPKLAPEMPKLAQHGNFPARAHLRLAFGIPKLAGAMPRARKLA